jgi:hypothetical protein
MNTDDIEFVIKQMTAGAGIKGGTMFSDNKIAFKGKGVSIVVFEDDFAGCRSFLKVGNEYAGFLASVESSEPIHVANVIQQSLSTRDKMASCINALKDEGWDASVHGCSSYASSILVSNGNRSAVLHIPYGDGVVVYGKNYRSVANTLARHGIIEDCRKDSFDSRHIHKFI